MYTLTFHNIATVIFLNSTYDNDIMKNEQSCAEYILNESTNKAILPMARLI